MTNPFSISFGREPSLLISRPVQKEKIIGDFTADPAPTQTYIITGVRGSGKTVAMTEISARLAGEKKWIVMDLNPEADLFRQIAGKLADHPILRPLFIQAEINLSLLGFGLNIKNIPPVSDISTAIERMLSVLKKHGYRLLLTIDEVTSNPFLRVFVHAFQGWTRQNYPVFLLMTGLYENISELQNVKSLTFLYRAPKVYMQPLNLQAIAASYKNVFQLSAPEAEQMARLTGGYPFAFQVLGYLRWNRRDEPLENLLSDYDQYLQDYVYEKIWSELSEKDREIVSLIAAGTEKNKEIREKLHMSSGMMSVYRKRLLDKGIVDGADYGKLHLTLPRFDVFVNFLNQG